MVKYKVSVILPVYNGEKTLATTLESLVNQTFKDFELVCCIVIKMKIMTHIGVDMRTMVSK